MAIEKKIKPCQSLILHLHNQRLNHASGTSLPQNIPPQFSATCSAQMSQLTYTGTFADEYELSLYRAAQSAGAHGNISAINLRFNQLAYLNFSFKLINFFSLLILLFSSQGCLHPKITSLTLSLPF